MDHPSRISIEKLLEDCVIERTKRGGPGGQHRNKVESAVVVTHRPSGIRGQASERRSQHANRSVAIERLRLNLAVEIRLPVERSAIPSEIWKSRSHGKRISVNVSHTDFPHVLSEALDVVAFCEFEMTPAANRLRVSASQLTKLLKQHRPAFERVNSEREFRRLGKLK